MRAVDHGLQIEGLRKAGLADIWVSSVPHEIGAARWPLPDIAAQPPDVRFRGVKNELAEGLRQKYRLLNAVNLFTKGRTTALNTSKKHPFWLTTQSYF